MIFLFVYVIFAIFTLCIVFDNDFKVEATTLEKCLTAFIPIINMILPLAFIILFFISICRLLKIKYYD